MKSITLVFQLVGAVLLGASGTQLATSLKMDYSTTAALAGFAVAIVLFAAAPVRALRDRVASLENTVATQSASAGSSPTAV